MRRFIASALSLLAFSAAAYITYRLWFTPDKFIYPEWFRAGLPLSYVILGIALLMRACNRNFYEVVRGEVIGHIHDPGDTAIVDDGSLFGERINIEEAVGPVYGLKIRGTNSQGNGPYVGVLMFQSPTILRKYPKGSDFDLANCADQLTTN